MITYHGTASSWYRDLYRTTLSSGSPVLCRQGLGIELDSPVSVEIPGGVNSASALGAAMTQRRAPIGQRIGFSVAHGIQKFLGLPDSALSKKFPILLRYIRNEEETDHARISMYLREKLPTEITRDAPWISDLQTDHGLVSSIDQLHFALDLLRNQSTQTSRRAYIDFNEGYKPRCVSSWHFVVRRGALIMFQAVRSNDLLVGLPNDLIAARIAQIVSAKIVGVAVGPLFHSASLIQVYRPDCAGIDGEAEFKKIIFDDNVEDVGNALTNSSRLARDFCDLVESIRYAGLGTGAALGRVRADLSSLLDSYINSQREIAAF